jgi:hypothetical protein
MGLFFSALFKKEKIKAFGSKARIRNFKASVNYPFYFLV